METVKTLVVYRDTIKLTSSGEDFRYIIRIEREFAEPIIKKFSDKYTLKVYLATVGLAIDRTDRPYFARVGGKKERLSFVTFTLREAGTEMVPMQFA